MSGGEWRAPTENPARQKRFRNLLTRSIRKKKAGRQSLSDNCSPLDRTEELLNFDRTGESELQPGFRRVADLLTFRSQYRSGTGAAAYSGPDRRTLAAAGNCTDHSTNTGAATN